MIAPLLLGTSKDHNSIEEAKYFVSLGESGNRIPNHSNAHWVVISSCAFVGTLQGTVPSSRIQYRPYSE